MFPATRKVFALAQRFENGDEQGDDYIFDCFDDVDMWMNMNWIGMT